MTVGFTGIILFYVLFRIIRYLAQRTSSPWMESLIRNGHRPLLWFLPILLMYFSTPFLPISPKTEQTLSGTLSSILIVIIAWFLIRLTSVLEDLILSYYSIQTKDNLQDRKISTQVHIIKKTAIMVIAIIAGAKILMSFERFRQIGTGILASAGLAGLILGFAGQRIFANFLAGIQIAFTQPIRMDDVVTVENEWGRIEEITLTYVVVRIWDLRRLILPISYFIDKPFQNWTRVSANLLGTVFIYVDYQIPIPEVREELHRILQNSTHWDGQVWALQVTNTTDRVMELRALMSAVDSSLTWDLRCEVREKLIGFIQQEFPEAMPQVRLQQISEPPNMGSLPGSGCKTRP